MTIEEAHIDFKIKYDKVDTKFNKNFKDEEIDWLLNNAQYHFIRTRFHGSNIAKASFEDNSSRVNELSTLHIQFPEEPEHDVIPVDYGNYKLAKLPVEVFSDKYLYLTSISAYNLDCKAWVLPIFQDHATYLEEILNPFNAENYIFNINGENDKAVIYLYGNVSKVRVSYLKHPNRVFKGTYNNPFISSTAPVQFSLPEHTHPIIVDIAVELAASTGKIEPSSKEISNVYS